MFVTGVVFPMNVVLLFFLIFLVGVVTPMNVTSGALLFPTEQGVCLTPLLEIRA